ncbi:FAD-dependent oxidoreductase [Mesorhizobium sp.]|uniref:GcvT family protein n=1 Tax=Mesorhizobium sp. TaxID=1871066 RepID=UPI0025FF4025|nr:FAD-dependent oxidoreductase [Mesorhizobium sp.]
MRTARVVVIGGGVVGASVLYHLTKLGWTDVIMLERKVLTAGSTWHAAAGFFALNGDPNMAKLQAYGIGLFKEIEKESGQNVGLHMCGGINVASTDARWEFLRAEAAKHKVMGLESHLIGPDEVKALNPLIDTDGVKGALYDPNEGHLDPYGCTHAYVKAARARGATLLEQTRVTDLKQRADGGWDVITDNEVIVAEHVVNAGGLWAREVGAMAGVSLPLTPFEHHYLITEEIPELKAHGREIALTVDLDNELYMRQEHNGVLLGVYETPATPWSLSGTPWTYGESDLLPPRLDRLEDALVRGFARFPSVAEAGIKRIVNGPFTFSPDGNPLVGPVPGLRNYWAACGVMAGFSQGGGIGLTLAQWMINGDPGSDVFFAMDVSRFGDFASRDYCVAKGKQFYERRFRIAYPNETWPAARPCRTSPVYDDLKEQGARFAESFGLEVPLYFAPRDFDEEYTFRRNNALQFVNAEVQATANAAGLLDASSFSKFLITGSKAEKFLDRLIAGKLPKPGRVRLATLLNEEGRLMGDMTCARLSDNGFLLMGSGYLQGFHTRWFEENLSESHVAIRNLTRENPGFVLSGPASRQIIAEALGIDASNAAIPMLSVHTIATDFPITLARISLSGELGYEVYCDAKNMPDLRRKLLAAGAGHGLREIGMRSLNAMRVEKSAGVWSLEFTPNYTPAMCGLDRFVDYEKSYFVGRDAALRDRDAPPARKLVTFELAAEDADVSGYEPVSAGKQLVGFVTSGAWGPRTKKSLAMAYVDRAALTHDDFSVEILSRKIPARLLEGCAYDPAGTRMRS